MKFAEAVRLSAITKTYEGTIWFLSSYNPSILTTFLQSWLIAQKKDQPAPAVKSFRFDSLWTSLDETSSNKALFEPAVLSLVLEDFNPAWGWRARQSAGTQDAEALAPSAPLIDKIVHWAETRTKAGASSWVILPTLTWAPRSTVAPSILLDAKTLQLQNWILQLGHQLQQAGAVLVSPSNTAFDLRSLLEGGCPWSVESARDTAQQLAWLLSPSEAVKALVLDLDNTLWPGILEDGSALEKAQAESPLSSPYYRLGQLLLQLQNQGIYLACCSKNDLADVEKYFAILCPTFQLSQFNAIQIGWGTKSKGVQNILNEFNVLAKNILFIDDNPAEILEVKNVHPDIQTLQTPQEPREWPLFLDTLRTLCFKKQVLPEDRLRLEQKRPALKANTLSSSLLDTKAYLQSLKLQLSFKKEAWDDPRTLDLINKTNQFTLNGQRFTLAQLQDLRKRPGAWCWSVQLQDQYGTFGTIGTAWGTQRSDTLTIEAWALSCRAFDRHVEYVFLESLLKEYGVKALQMQFQATAKNQHARQFLDTLKIPIESGHFTLLKDLLTFCANKRIEAGYCLETA